MVKPMINVWALVLAIVLGGATAQAARYFRPYAGVGVGVFDININQGGVHGSTYPLGVFGIFGADFTDYLGAEVRIGFNNVKFGNANGFTSLLGKLQFPATDDLRVYALGGITQASLSASAPYNGGSGATKNGLSYGGGVRFKLSERNSISVEWLRYWDNVFLVPGVHATFDGLSVMGNFHF